MVDTTARWQINDALKFIQTVQNERGAKARLDAILDATTRDTISNHNLVEAVRNTNAILDYIDKIDEEKGGIPQNDEKIKRDAAGVLISEWGFQSFGITLADGRMYFFRITSYNVCYTKLLRELNFMPKD